MLNLQNIVTAIFQIKWFSVRVCVRREIIEY